MFYVQFWIQQALVTSENKFKFVLSLKNKKHRSEIILYTADQIISTDLSAHELNTLY